MNQSIILQELIREIGEEKACKLLKLTKEQLSEVFNSSTTHFYKAQIEILSQQVEWTTTQLNQVIERNNLYLSELNEFEQRCDDVGQTDTTPIPMDVLEGLDQAMSESAAFRSQTAHEAFNQHVNEEAKTQIAEIKRIKTNSDWRVIGIAASVVVCFLSALLVWQNLPKAQQKQPTALKVNKQVDRTLPELVIKSPKKAKTSTSSKVVITSPTKQPQVVKQPTVAPKKVEEKEEELVAFADNQMMEKLIDPKKSLPEGILMPSNKQQFELGQKIVFATKLKQKSRVKLFSNKLKKIADFKLQKGKIAEVGVRNLEKGKYYVEVRINNVLIVSSFTIQ
ncbi:hypothetical protein [Microscilla marina]|uniref:Uncharacterized protein n=1 Tax=Microscilla marina ATCC 23134 TaxID=313606 RepID=A1ZU84_MICM2|nr:hypothetical protein [Microscilla marina]EAY26055.1 hypothetical protein M23134_06404 [Microscilla marina ATCC 23134]